VFELLSSSIGWQTMAEYVRTTIVACANAKELEYKHT